MSGAVRIGRKRNLSAKSNKKPKQNISATPNQILRPQAAISIDPGTRNLGWAVLTFVSSISFQSIKEDINYIVVGSGRIDLKQRVPSDDEDEDTTTLAHLQRAIRYHFSIHSDGEFLLCIKSLINSGVEYEFQMYSENQEGIGAFDREINPFLPDMLMVQAWVSGYVTGTLSEKYNINLVFYPPKIGKWGNSSCPRIKITKSQSKTEKKKIQARNKTIRKNFFVYYVLDLMERQKNISNLNILYNMSMEDRSHVSDAITQGMRSLMTRLWLILSKMTTTKTSYTRLPSNNLQNDVLERVMKNLKVTDLLVHEKKKKPEKTKGITKKKRTSRMRLPVFVDV